MSEFKELQEVSLSIYDSHVKVVKQFYALISDLISQYSKSSDQIIIDDLEFAKELLTTLLTKLEPARSQLLNFTESQAGDLKTVVQEVSAYLRDDVLEMSELTIDAATEGALFDSEATEKLKQGKQSVVQLAEIIKCYTDGELNKLKLSLHLLSV